MTDDGTLLREFARTGAETAFAELVRRHMDLVYSAAMRVVAGDDGLARDVCQSVFLDLARKAPGLASRGSVGGWLYTSAVYAGSKVVRSERRRRAREEEALAMNESLREADPEPDWDMVRPVLDAAMIGLKEADREALVLRYFQNRPLAEVGARLGLSENAARMRVGRALEKLRGSMARQGVRSSATALSTLLAKQTVLSAPAGLAAAVTKASIAGVAGGGASLLTFTLMSNAKILVAGGVLAVGLLIPAVRQQRENKRLAEELAVMRASQTAMADKAGASVRPLEDEADEAARLRGQKSELMRLRGEVALLRQAGSNVLTRPGTGRSPEAAAGEASTITTEAVTEFLNRRPEEQGKRLGAMRGMPKPGWTPTPEYLEERALSTVVRPNLDQLESRPKDFAEFQSSFIQSAVGLQDEKQVADINRIIRETYEQATGSGLEAASRPLENDEAWVAAREVLDRQATKAVQDLLTGEEREKFDRLFIGVMGVDLGLGDGRIHRIPRSSAATPPPTP